MDRGKTNVLELATVGVGYVVHQDTYVETLELAVQLTVLVDGSLSAKVELNQLAFGLNLRLDFLHPL